VGGGGGCAGAGVFEGGEAEDAVAEEDEKDRHKEPVSDFVIGIDFDFSGEGDEAGEGGEGEDGVEDGAEQVGAEGEGEVSVEDCGPGGCEAAPWAGAIGEGGDDAGGQSELAVGAVEGGVGREVEGTDGGDSKPAEEDEKASARFSEGVNGLEERAQVGIAILRALIGVG